MLNVLVPILREVDFHPNAPDWIKTISTNPSDVTMKTLSHIVNLAIEKISAKKNNFGLYNFLNATGTGNISDQFDWSNWNTWTEDHNQHCVFIAWMLSLPAPGTARVVQE